MRVGEGAKAGVGDRGPGRGNVVGLILLGGCYPADNAGGAGAGPAPGVCPGLRVERPRAGRAGPGLGVAQQAGALEAAAQSGRPKRCHQSRQLGRTPPCSASIVRLMFWMRIRCPQEAAVPRWLTGEDQMRLDRAFWGLSRPLVSDKRARGFGAPPHSTVPWGSQARAVLSRPRIEILGRRGAAACKRGQQPQQRCVDGEQPTGAPSQASLPRGRSLRPFTAPLQLPPSLNSALPKRLWAWLAAGSQRSPGSDTLSHTHVHGAAVCGIFVASVTWGDCRWCCTCLGRPFLVHHDPSMVHMHDQGSPDPLSSNMLATQARTGPPLAARRPRGFWRRCRTALPLGARVAASLASRAYSTFTWCRVRLGSLGRRGAGRRLAIAADASTRVAPCSVSGAARGDLAARHGYSLA